MRLAIGLLALLCAACAPGRADPPGGPPPIVLISVDTLRADRLGAYGGGDLSPNLDRFAREAVVFEHAFAQANLTLHSHAALFTSRYASELSPMDYRFAFPEGTPTLAGVLGLYGYATAGVSGGGHLDPVFGLGEGFDDYRVGREWGSLYHAVQPALAWLDAQRARAPEAPWFLFVHGYDTHDRYLKPTPWGYAEAPSSYDGAARDVARRHEGTLHVAAGYSFPRTPFPRIFPRERLRIWGPEAREMTAALGDRVGIGLDDDDQEHIRGVYDGAVRYADAWFGLLMAALDNRGVLDEAIVVVISDHGEGLGESGVFNHRPNFEEPVLRVPLMVRLPGGEGGGRRIGGAAALIDVMPTLLDAAGAQPPADARGRSLWPALEDPTAADTGRPFAFAESSFRQIAAMTPSGALVFDGISPSSRWLPALLASARLDGPAFDGWGDGDQADSRAALREALVGWRSGLTVHGATDAPALTDEQRRILRERGYW